MPGADRKAWAQLCLAPGVGPRTVHQLLQAFGSIQAVLDASPASLADLVGSTVAQAVVAGPEADLLARTLAWADQPEHHLLTWEDAAFPRALLQIPDPPPLLFFQGNTSLLDTPALAIVGSRNATHQGRETARAFAKALGDAGFAIVSGLALGIDTAAHEGGLASAGSSLAVLGTGIDRVYPAANRALAHRLATHGALLSEFPVGTPPTAGNFPRRNRLISGLSRGCLVVEATINSGSLITARFSLEQGREVFAIPGSIHSPFSKGPHKLIRDGAKLVETAQDVLEELGFPPSAPGADPKAGAGHADDASPVLEALGFDPAAPDTLSARCRLPVEQVLTSLLELELAGRVKSLPGGLFQRVI